jgi:hypothetical protein
MLTAFWSGLGDEFAKRWAARILTPAFAFWAGGLFVLWWHAHAHGVGEHGWAHELSATTAWLRGLPGLAQAVLVVVGLILLTASALIAERLTLPLLQLLEGYWPRPRWLRNKLIAYRRWRHRRWDKCFKELNLRQRYGDLSTAEFHDLRTLEATPSLDSARLQQLRQRREAGITAQQRAELERRRGYLHRSPPRDDLGMPTKLGDILRAAEYRPGEKYGLDAVICWYALWLLLPADAKTELVQARTTLDNAARGWLWGALFLVWTPWSWWALPVGVLIPVLTYYVGILGAAALFGELMVTAYDLYRFKLYDSLHLPRPTSPALERKQDGPRVTNLLWGGLDEPGLVYVDPPADGASTS